MREQTLFNALIIWGKSVVAPDVPVIRFPVQIQEPKGLFVGLDITSDESNGGSYTCDGEVNADGLLEQQIVTPRILSVSVNAYDCGAFDLARDLAESLNDPLTIREMFMCHNMSVSGVQSIARLHEYIQGQYKDRAQFSFSLSYSATRTQCVELAAGYCNSTCEENT